MLFADSLVQGFIGSNFMGQALVVAQLLGSVVMVAAILGKAKELHFVKMLTRRFKNDFANSSEALEYYVQRRPAPATGIVEIYRQTCDRLLRLLAPDTQSLVAGKVAGEAALTAREVELVRGTCEHALDEEELRLEHGMGVISTVVALEPMVGLLGTVWGVLDAFAEMGTAGSANLATIAPSISAALVTTVVGLLVAIPGVLAHTALNASVQEILSEMEGTVDDLMGRIACEFQGRGA
jgi:biopolymer transport protein TolQ